MPGWPAAGTAAAPLPGMGRPTPPLATYTPVPAPDAPIGYRISTLPPRSRVGRRLGGLAGVVVAVLVLALKIFVFSHAASSLVSSGGTSSPQLDTLDAAVGTLTTSLNAAQTADAAATALRTFDSTLRGLTLSGQADEDRATAISSDEVYANDLVQDSATLHADQLAHIDAVNRLARDLGATEDVITLGSSTSG